VAETIREFIGVKDVSFTPDGQSTIDLPMEDDDAVEHVVRTEDIRHRTASGKYVRFVHTVRVADEITVRCKDLSVLDDPNLAIGTDGTLSYTLIGAGLVAGGDRTVSAQAKVVRPTAWPGTDGNAPSEGSVTFALLSGDGTSDPKNIQ
jgi:hypothetical protein